MSHSLTNTHTHHSASEQWQTAGHTLALHACRIVHVLKNSSSFHEDVLQRDGVWLQFSAQSLDHGHRNQTLPSNSMTAQIRDKRFVFKKEYLSTRRREWCSLLGQQDCCQKRFKKWTTDKRDATQPPASDSLTDTVLTAKSQSVSYNRSGLTQIVVGFRAERLAELDLSIWAVAPSICC